MNRRQRRHAAKHHHAPEVTGSLVVRDGRVTITGPIPGLGRELARGYYARQARRFLQAREAARAAQEGDHD